VDAYLAVLCSADRQALESVCCLILDAVPGSTERVAYGMPVFRLEKDLVALGAHKKHLSFYIMSTAVPGMLGNELSGHTLSGSTIHFSSDHPPSPELIENILRLRREENQGGPIRSGEDV
jgi:uncharacterized protein YdhG (YjbR/CyaY superfamily)